MGKFFKDLFSDSNDINENTFVGVMSFFAMIIILIMDIISSFLNKPTVVKEFIFDGFLYLTLGAFGWTVAGRIFKKKTTDTETQESNDTKPEEPAEKVEG